MSYTPGPWEVREEIDGMPAVEKRKTRVFDAAGMQVASTFNQTRMHQQHTFAAAEGNARLIAAAPQMYEALRAIVMGDHLSATEAYAMGIAALRAADPDL